MALEGADRESGKESGRELDGAPDHETHEGTPEVRWLSDAEQRSWRAILRGTRLLERALDRALDEAGIQLSEYEILSMLSEAPRGRLRMSEIADMVVQSRSRLTHTGTRLAARGWVTREACADDKRGVELVLTQPGWEAVRRISRIHVQSVRDNIVDIMPPEQFAALGDAMTIVRDHLDPSSPPETRAE